jgi:hypothetical protein
MLRIMGTRKIMENRQGKERKRMMHIARKQRARSSFAVALFSTT